MLLKLQIVCQLIISSRPVKSGILKFMMPEWTFPLKHYLEEIGYNITGE